MAWHKMTIAWRSGWMLALGVLTVTVACGTQDDRGQSASGALGTQQMGDVSVATVGGRPIYAFQVREVMREEGVDRSGALQRLIDEELLVQDAERFGLGKSQQVRQEVERRMVQSLLADIEERESPESVSAEEVREDFETYKDKLIVPERRKVFHVLAAAQTKEAEAFANAVLAELRRADDPKKVFERYLLDPPKHKFKVRAEDLPAITTKTGFEEEFKTAVFAPKRPGALARAVRTSHGWHAIFVEKIEPGEDKTLADLDSDIRTRLSQKHRFEAMASIVREAEAAGVAKRNEEVIGRALKTDLFKEDSP